MNEFLIFSDKPLNGFRSVVRRYAFPNGFGASVVAYRDIDGGLFEVAVLHNDKICYTTDLTSDVLPGCTEDEVQAILGKIKELEPVESFV
jgi:hypothetical protein